MFKMKKLGNIPEVALWPKEVDYNGGNSGAGIAYV